MLKTDSNLSEMPRPDKVILIHQGALGDFLCAWPSLAGLCAHFSGSQLYFAGSGEYLDFLRPLGARALPPDLRRALERLYLTPDWPGELEDALVVRFGLNKRPDLPEHPNLLYLLGLRDGVVHPRVAYIEQLAAVGVPELADWKGRFRELFGHRGARSARVLLFPGAGHPAKAWPLVQFFKLASWLASQGLEALFVLGPAELERGLAIAEWPVAAPRSLAELCGLLGRASCAVGGDCGPMHLAGMLGTPGLALFGPTSGAQWGPVDVSCLSLGLACSPCTNLTRELACPDPRCLSELSWERVTEALGNLLDF